MVNPGDGSSAGLVLYVIAVFLVVAALAVYSLRFLSRRLPGLGGGGNLRLLEQLYLGPNRAVCLVAVADRVLVLGVSERGVTLLQTIDDPDTVATLQRQRPGDSGGGRVSSFAAQLRQLLGRESEPSAPVGEQGDALGADRDRPAFSTALSQGLERLRQLRRGEETE